MSFALMEDSISTQAFIRVVENNLLSSCPINRQGILAAEDNFGPNVGSLKGKKTRRTPEKVDMTTASILVEIMSRYKDVTLAADIMKLNFIPFLVSISRSINFGLADML